jgi:hypothetical protein
MQCNNNRFPPGICATAITYFKRFYVHHTMMDHDPRRTALTAVYVATKTEETHVDVGVLAKQMQVTPEWLVRWETRLLAGLSFHLHCFHPYHGIDGHINSLAHTLLASDGDGDGDDGNNNGGAKKKKEKKKKTKKKATTTAKTGCSDELTDEVTTAVAAARLAVAAAAHKRAGATFNDGGDDAAAAGLPALPAGAADVFFAALSLSSSLRNGRQHADVAAGAGAGNVVVSPDIDIDAATTSLLATALEHVRQRARAYVTALYFTDAPLLVRSLPRTLMPFFLYYFCVRLCRLSICGVPMHIISACASAGSLYLWRAYVIVLFLCASATALLLRTLMPSLSLSLSVCIFVNFLSLSVCTFANFSLFLCAHLPTFSIRVVPM